MPSLLRRTRHSDQQIPTGGVVFKVASSHRIQMVHPFPRYPTITRSPSTITGIFRWPFESVSIFFNARGSSITLT
jgi:hypothetical protein